MNPGSHNEHHPDKDLEQVSRAYREIQPEEPPALLDQAVLGKARRAVESKSVRPWNFGWIHAVTTTAVVVLAVAVVMQQPEDPALSVQSPQAPDAGQFQALGDAQDRREMAADELEEAAMEQPLFEKKSVPGSFADPVTPGERQDAPVDAKRLQPGKTDKPGRETVLKQESAIPPTTESVSANSEIREEADADGELKAAGHEVRGKVELFKDADESVETEPEEPMTIGAGAPDDKNLAPAAPVMATAGFRVSAESSAGNEERTRENMEAQQAMSISSERESTDGAVGDMLMMSLEDPAAWLERIRQLKEADELEAFEAELQDFQEAWPDYPLPEDLVTESAPGGS